MKDMAGLPAVLHAYGFPRWKHPVVRQCFPGQRVRFVPRGAAVPADACVLLWGMQPPPDGLSVQARVLRIEDGFLRSVGLGADLVRPMSWVVDGCGIYYNATQPSDLECLLSTHVFDAALRARAAALRERIVAARLTKYNVGQKTWERPTGERGDRRVVLVPGQVETDASIGYGAPGERTNLGLLRSVRQANPDAWLVYKPHPDVLVRLRLAGQDESEAGRWCDEVVTDVDMGSLLAAVDEVHVLTSLAGFEALLRGKPVTCHGQPFYSGWGLTRDVAPHARRGRALTLDELVAGALILYPLYLARDGKGLIEPEQALDALLAWRARAGGREPWWRGLYRMVLRRFSEVG